MTRPIETDKNEMTLLSRHVLESLILFGLSCHEKYHLSFQTFSANAFFCPSGDQLRLYNLHFEDILPNWIFKKFTRSLRSLVF